MSKNSVRVLCTLLLGFLYLYIFYRVENYAYEYFHLKRLYINIIWFSWALFLVVMHVIVYAFITGALEAILEIAFSNTAYNRTGESAAEVGRKVGEAGLIAYGLILISSITFQLVANSLQPSVFVIIFTFLVLSAVTQNVPKEPFL